MAGQTELQEKIVTYATHRPEWSDGQIAEALDCSRSYVREIRKRYSWVIAARRFGIELRELFK